jgi:hypothetical protein
MPQVYETKLYQCTNCNWQGRRQSNYKACPKCKKGLPELVETPTAGKVGRKMLNVKTICITLDENSLKIAKSINEKNISDAVRTALNQYKISSQN